jgi:hypothetical protein
VSYEQLSEHAVHFQQLAIHQSLKHKGWTDLGNGALRAPKDVDAADSKEIEVRTEQRFAGVAGIFTPFLTLPDPDRFTPMLDGLSSAMNMLSSGQGSEDPVNKTVVTANPAMEGMTTVSKNVHDWRGAAATAFQENFVEPFPAITANQFALVATLNGAIEAEQALWADCRKNVDDLAHKAIKALEVLDDCHHGEQVCLLTVASSVFAVAAALTTGGAALGLTVAGATAQAMSGVPHDDPPKLEFDGQTAEAVVAQVQAGLNRLTQLTNAKEREVANAMTASAKTLAGNRKRFVSPPPALAHATASTITGPSGLGEAV